MDRIEAMQVFLAAVDEGSLSAAGRRLRMPLTSVSRKLADLETHLGVRLLTRTTRHDCRTPRSACEPSRRADRRRDPCSGGPLPVIRRTVTCCWLAAVCAITAMLALPPSAAGAPKIEKKTMVRSEPNVYSAELEIFEITRASAAQKRINDAIGDHARHHAEPGLWDEVRAVLLEFGSLHQRCDGRMALQPGDDLLGSLLLRGQLRQLQHHAHGERVDAGVDEAAAVHAAGAAEDLDVDTVATAHGEALVEIGRAHV